MATRCTAQTVGSVSLSFGGYLVPNSLYVFQGLKRLSRIVWEPDYHGNQVCVRVDDVERQVAVSRSDVQQENDEEIEQIVDEFDAVGDSQSGQERARDAAQLATA